MLEQRASIPALVESCCFWSGFSGIPVPTSSRTRPFSSLPTTRSPFTRARKGSFNASDFSSSGGSDGAGLPRDGSSTEGPRETQGGTLAERRGEKSPAPSTACSKQTLLASELLCAASRSMETAPTQSSSSHSREGTPGAQILADLHLRSRQQPGFQHRWVQHLRRPSPPGRAHLKAAPHCRAAAALSFFFLFSLFLYIFSFFFFPPLPFFSFSFSLSSEFRLHRRQLLIPTYWDGVGATQPALHPWKAQSPQPLVPLATPPPAALLAAGTAPCTGVPPGPPPALTAGFALAGEFGHKLQRLSSNGTMSSSEELGEKDENAASFEQSM